MAKPALFPIRTTRGWWIISTALTVCLGISAIALAGYVPPPYSPPPDSPDATGTRGPCSQNQQTVLDDRQMAITALAPQHHIGHTISAHPTFAWFVNDRQSFPMEFHLYESHPDGDRQLVKINLRSSPGLMLWSLPDDEPGLMARRRYRWQVVLVCNPNRYSNSRVTGATFDVVAAQPDLRAAIDGATDASIRSEIYAQQGLWYDAFSETRNLPNATAARALRLQLLEDLARLEESAHSETPNQEPDQALKLRQIIDFENQSNDE